MPPLSRRRDLPGSVFLQWLPVLRVQGFGSCALRALHGGRLPAASQAWRTGVGCIQGYPLLAAPGLYVAAEEAGLPPAGRQRLQFFFAHSRRRDLPGSVFQQWLPVLRVSIASLDYLVEGSERRQTVFPRRAKCSVCSQRSIHNQNTNKAFARVRVVSRCDASRCSR